MEQRRRKTPETALLLGAGVVTGILGLPLVLPFVLAWGIALGAERGVRFLGERTRLPRWARSGLCVTALFLGVGAAVFFFLRVLWEELVRLVRQLPELLTRLRPTLEELRVGLEGLALRIPGSLGKALAQWLEELFDGGAGLLDSLYGFLSGLVSAVVKGLPGLFMALVTTVIAAYMTSAALPEVKSWLRARLPETWQTRLRTLRHRARTAFGGWIRAEAKLLVVVFALLSLGMWILGVEFALLFGGLIALLDALPVLGTGTVLIPWALICFLQGEAGRGAGLLVLYALCALTRAALEPRLVGRQLGLHPLPALMAFYAGWRLFGAAGMLLLPPAAMIAAQLLTRQQSEE